MNTDKFRAQLRRTPRRDLWITAGPAILVTAIAFAVTFHFITPAPPSYQEPG